MEHRVAIVGQGMVTAFGESWDDNKKRILECKIAVVTMQDWDYLDSGFTGSPFES